MTYGLDLNKMIDEMVEENKNSPPFSRYIRNNLFTDTIHYSIVDGREQSPLGLERTIKNFDDSAEAGVFFKHITRNYYQYLVMKKQGLLKQLWPNRLYIDNEYEWLNVIYYQPPFISIGDEILEWCKENKIECHMYYDDKSILCYADFENESDATLFRLRWLND